MGNSQIYIVEIQKDAYTGARSLSLPVCLCLSLSLSLSRSLGLLSLSLSERERPRGPLTHAPLDECPQLAHDDECKHASGRDVDVALRPQAFVRVLHLILPAIRHGVRVLLRLEV